MAEANLQKSTNAWIAIDNGLDADVSLAPYTLRLKGESSLYKAISDEDWVLILNTAAHITRVGRVMRIRSDLKDTTIYFDRILLVDPAVSIGLTSLTPPSSGSVGRIQWTDFFESLPKALHKTIADVPTIEDQAYIRELLQLAVMDDLLGPAGGPHERIVDMGVRDRYLVGNWLRVRLHKGALKGWTGRLPMTMPKSPRMPRLLDGMSQVQSLERSPGEWNRSQIRLTRLMPPATNLLCLAALA